MYQPERVDGGGRVYKRKYSSGEGNGNTKRAVWSEDIRGRRRWGRIWPAKQKKPIGWKAGAIERTSVCVGIRENARVRTTNQVNWQKNTSRGTSTFPVHDEPRRRKETRAASHKEAQMGLCAGDNVGEVIMRVGGYGQGRRDGEGYLWMRWCGSRCERGDIGGEGDRGGENVGGDRDGGGIFGIGGNEGV